MESVGTGEAQSLSLPAAAKLIGKSQTTLRNWLKTGVLKAERDGFGRWKIDRTTLLGAAASLATVRPQNVVGAQYEDTQRASHEATLIEVYKESLSRERKINDELREQVKNLESEIIRLSHEMQAILSQDDSSGTLSRWLKSKIR